MSSHMQIPCPNCQRSLKIRPEYLGHRVVCKYCEHQFIAQAPAAPSDPDTSEGPTLEEIWERESHREEAPKRPQPAPRRPDSPTSLGPANRSRKDDTDDSSLLIPVRRDPPEPEDEAPFDPEASAAGRDSSDANASPHSELERLRAENAWLRAEVQLLREELGEMRTRDGSFPNS